MKSKLILLTCLFCLIPFVAQAGSVDLRWDAVTGAVGYKLYQSIDNGTTWNTGTDVANVTEATVSVVETQLVLIKVSAYAASGESIRHWSGAWYDGRKKPILTPGGAGIH